MQHNLSLSTPNTGVQEARHYGKIGVLCTGHPYFQILMDAGCVIAQPKRGISSLNAIGKVMTRSVIEFRPLSDSIGAEVVGVSMAESLDEKVYTELRDAWLQYQVLLFREQHITIQQQIDFSRHFGELFIPNSGRNIHPKHPEVLVFSNIKVNNKYIGQSPAVTGEGWHSDFFYMNKPATASILRAEEAPQNVGETWFANMYKAYDALPKIKRHQIDGLTATYSQARSFSLLDPSRRPLSKEEASQTPDVTHPLARTHPETGKKAIFAGMRGSVGAKVKGMGANQSVEFLEDLRSFATKLEFCYCHRWQPGDVILWDNRCTMHRASIFSDFEGQRLCYRTTIAGEVPY